MGKYPVIFAALLLAAGSASAAVVPIGDGSYTTTLPAGKSGPQAARYKTSNIWGPIPTNDWWTSVVASNTPYRMFAYPLAYRCDHNGLLIGLPKHCEQTGTSWEGREDVSPYRQQIEVMGVYNNGVSSVTAGSVKVDGYGDWTVKTLWQDTGDATKSYTATFGQGLVFTYFEFAESVDPRIVFPFDRNTGNFIVYNSTGGQITAGTAHAGYDHVTVQVNVPGSSVYYGVFASTGATFTLDEAYNGGVHQIDIELPANGRYLSVAVMNSPDDLSFFYDHAYAFVTGSNVQWNVDTAKSRVRTTFTVTTESKQYGQDSTVLALFPHQWKNSTNTYLSQSYAALRGTMTCIAGNSFIVNNNFNGLLPSLPGRGDYDTTHLKSLLDTDKTKTFSSNATYEHGKEMSRMADLIPLAAQAGETFTRNALIAALKASLADWYAYTPGEASRYFYYDTNWGSLIGYNTCYGSENFNDQHFHFGYFVYASALLALYDPGFIQHYGGMTEMLIRSYASSDRNDPLFPFLRTFSPYEGHSWADGRALSNDGNNQESSSEAMNSWAAIYLWGLATGNNTYRDLGIWGFATEYSATREYYFDVDNEQYGDIYGHNNVGILWGGKAHYWIWFTPYEPETFRGIQMLPVNSSHLYLGYTTSYMAANYQELVDENGGTETIWQDTIWKYQALYDPAAALAKYSESIACDDGNSQAFTYHWVYSLNAMGAVDTGVYADNPSYAVFIKGSRRTCVALNPTAAAVPVRFYRRADDSLIGTLQLDPYTMASTTDFTTVTREFLSATDEAPPSEDTGMHVRVYPNPYKPGSGTLYDRAAGMVFSGLPRQSKIRIYTISGELVFEGSETGGDGRFEWNAANNNGGKVASGIYLYVATSPAGQQNKGKLVVIR